MKLMLDVVQPDSSLTGVTYQQILRQACVARKSTMTFGGITPIEGRRSADVANVETEDPSVLTSSGHSGLTTSCTTNLS